MTIRFLPVESAQVAAVGFELANETLGTLHAAETAGTLYVKFHNGTVWAYSRVTCMQFCKLVSAPSVGQVVSEIKRAHDGKLFREAANKPAKADRPATRTVEETPFGPVVLESLGPSRKRGR